MKKVNLVINKYAVMRYILIVISFFVTLNIYSQPKELDFRYSLGTYIENRHLYRDKDSLQLYLFKILFDNKEKVRNFTTFYFSPKNEIISFSDSTSFKDFKVGDIEGISLRNYNFSTACFLQPYILKKVEYVVNPGKDFHFSANNISSVFELLSKIANKKTGTSYILKPIIVFHENPVN